VESRHWVVVVAVAVVERSSNSSRMEQFAVAVAIVVPVLVVVAWVQEVDWSLPHYSWPLGEVVKRGWTHSYLVQMLVFA
jgi:hypothetical protein